MEGNHHSRALRLETAQAKAVRSISEELGRRGWKESDLLIYCKSDPAKMAIAARLHLGTSKSANVRFYDWMSRSTPAACATVQAQLGI